MFFGAYLTRPSPGRWGRTNHTHKSIMTVYDTIPATVKNRALVSSELKWHADFFEAEGWTTHATELRGYASEVGGCDRARFSQLNRLATEAWIDRKRVQTGGRPR